MLRTEAHQKPPESSCHEYALSKLGVSVIDTSSIRVTTKTGVSVEGNKETFSYRHL